jgi:hypothetical protein
VSIAGDGLAVISLGVSCQTAMQIRAHIRLITELAGVGIATPDINVDISSFPFDWRIMPAKGFCTMAAEGEFFPASMDDVRHAPPLPPAWAKHECFLWHDFLVAESSYDVPRMFQHDRAKHAYKMQKLMALMGRRIFILSNTQNNLDGKATVTGLDFSLSRADVQKVKEAIADMFPSGSHELIVVTRLDRAMDNPATWPACTYVFDPTTVGMDDVEGDYAQWNDMFRRYFTRDAGKEAEAHAGMTERLHEFSRLFSGLKWPSGVDRLFGRHKDLR